MRADLVFNLCVIVLVLIKYVSTAAPEIHGLATTIQLLESASASTTVSLYTLNATDPDGDSFYCDIISTSPPVTGFQVITLDLYLVSNPGFEYDITNQYTLTFQCTDVNNETSTAKNLIVDILPNTPPVITGLPYTVTVNDGEDGPKLLYDITASDNDTFTCNFTSVPTGPFNYQTTSGRQIYLNASPGLNAATTSTYTLKIVCADIYGASIGTLIINVVGNSPPSIINLPTSVSIKESVSGGSSIFTLNVSDPDSDSYTCLMTSTPTSTYFTLPLTTQYDVMLVNGHGLEYDTTSSYALNITCTDENNLATSKPLTVNIQPNSVPVIGNLPFTVFVTESETAERELIGLTVTDAESDAYTCTATTTGPFTMRNDTTTYRIYLNASPSLNYAATSTYTVSVTCQDNYGTSAAGVLTVQVQENTAPVISGLPKSVTVLESASGGSSIYTMTVTDTDAYTCDINSSSPVTSDFSMVPSGATQFDVHLNTGHSLNYQLVNSYDLTLQCTDAFGKTSSGILTVSVQENSPPNIANMPAVATVTSGETGNRVLLTVTVTDADSFICTMTSFPSSTQFSYDVTSKEIKVVSNPTFGGTTTFALTVTCDDTYGTTSKNLTVTVLPNSPPVITGLPTTVTVSETATTATCLHTVAVTDPESQTITCAVTSAPAGPFEMVQDPAAPSYRVCLLSNAIASLDGILYPTHNVTVTCSDTSGSSASSILYIDVTPEQAPTITGLPVNVEVKEHEAVERKLHDLTVTDPEGDSFTCALTTLPAGGPFDLRRDSATLVYSLYLDNNPGLNYTAIPSYTCTFTCTDSPKGRSSSNTLQVDVLENRPPVFTNLPATGTPNAMTTLKYASIFTVTATDADSDTVLYSMELTPKTSSFVINRVTGAITANRDLKYELVQNFVANVTATDSRLYTHSLFTITLQNINTLPTISSMTLNGITSLYFPELTTAAGSNLYTPTIYDPDAAQTQTITMYVYPSGQTDMFEVNANVIKLAAGKSFDYETLNYYRLSLYVTDSMATNGPYHLAIHVLDDPEVCSFPHNTYRYDTYEGGIGGGDINLGFSSLIEDKDNPDSHTYSLLTTAYSNLFNISKTTGVITYAVNYDIDRSHPQNVSVIVKCTDSHGETGTTTVSMFIQDINDNEPDFTSSGYVMVVNQYTRPGTYIGRITANDIDQNFNGEVEYDGSSATGSGYFHVTKSGGVYLTREINYDYGTTHRFQVQAVDHGSPQLTGTSYIDIIYREISTTSTTTQASTYQDWWSKPENVAMVAILSILGLLLLALLAYLLLRFCLGRSCPSLSKTNCCKNCCKTQPSNKLRNPKNPGPDKFKLWDANDLNKQRDPYSTSDIESGLPERMVMK